MDIIQIIEINGLTPNYLKNYHSPDFLRLL